EADLREIDFGELEGLTLAEGVERYPAESRWMLAPAGAAFPGGESVAALRKRAVASAHAIATRHDGETAAVFSHAVVIRAILADARRFEALEAGPGALERLLERLPGARVVRSLAELDF